MSARETYKFGDIAESLYASDDNPRKRGIVVRNGHRRGKLNAGRYLVLTDGKGEFWERPLDSARKVGAMRFLGPGEMDAETLEEAACLAEAVAAWMDNQDRSLKSGGARELATAIRSLGRAALKENAE